MLGNLPTDEETARAFGALENKMNERVDALTAKFVESTNQTRLLVLAIGALQIALLVTVLVRS
ncbi:hypothetical protein SAMN06295912_107168 [Sphingomonas laterariae]|uniref:Uncharacterized protein n=2 Tax=Edaphosphingomonas laterariae TaxID=861865 RepID=A0A239EY79_9SPHN|nr:hypothetical protein SAMN06295912_107168 [Sphingomonas laterariae]